MLAIVGLLLAGGILLLWVCWKMYRDIKAASHAMEPAYAGGASRGGSDVKTITFSAALIQIVIADASMSLDNVLAVAGAAKGDMTVLVIGLVVAVAFMGFMSHYIARLLTRHAWITWIGLAIILYVAVGHDLVRLASGRLPVRAGRDLPGRRARGAADAAVAPIEATRAGCYATRGPQPTVSNHRGREAA